MLRLHQLLCLSATIVSIVLFSLQEFSDFGVKVNGEERENKMHEASLRKLYLKNSSSARASEYD